MKDLLIIRHAESSRITKSLDSRRLSIGAISEAACKGKMLKQQGYDFIEMGVSESARTHGTARAMGAEKLTIYPMLNEIEFSIGRYRLANMLTSGMVTKEVYRTLLETGEKILDELVPAIPESIEACVSHNTTIAAIVLARFKKEKKIREGSSPRFVIPHLGHIAVKR